MCQFVNADNQPDRSTCMYEGRHNLDSFRTQICRWFCEIHGLQFELTSLVTHMLADVARDQSANYFDLGKQRFSHAGSTSQTYQTLKLTSSTVWIQSRWRFLCFRSRSRSRLGIYIDKANLFWIKPRHLATRFFTVSTVLSQFFEVDHFSSHISDKKKSKCTPEWPYCYKIPSIRLPLYKTTVCMPIPHEYA